MTKPISRSQYNTFTSRRGFMGCKFSFSSSFIKTFDEKGLLSSEQIQRVKHIAKHDGESDARAYIEDELIQDMGDE